jgi:hypothetical protein
MYRVEALFPLILSLVSGLSVTNNGSPRREERKHARNQVCTANSRNCGITYRILREPKSRKTGDGAVVVREV